MELERPPENNENIFVEDENLLRKFVTPEFVFGLGARKLAGRYARHFGASKVLVVSDPGVVAVGWTGEVIASLEKERLQHELYSNVTPNPRASEVMAGAEVYRQGGCNVIVAVGGGSTIDCAKGIGIVSSNHRHILEFEGADKVEMPMPPLICIPTTAGTSADMSQFDIITDLDRKVKIAIVSKAVVPDISLIDPITLTTMDAYLTACTGLDAMVHAIEAFVSLGSSAMTDLCALEAIRVIRESLIPAVKEPHSLKWRTLMMRGSMMAGMAFSNASLGAVHAMAHSLGGLLDLAHGECNAILLPHVMDFNYGEASDKYRAIGDTLGIDMRGMNLGGRKKAILDEIMRLKQVVGVTQRLNEKGVGVVDIPDLAGKAIHDVCIVTNPRKANKRDIEVIYEEAL
jgi:alcohol dehydrogenase class IV